MPAKKIHILSPEAREACKQKIAEQNPSLEQGDFVYAGNIPIAMAFGNGQFKYLGPLAEAKKNKPVNKTNIRTILRSLDILPSDSDDISDYIIVRDVANTSANRLSKSPTSSKEPIKISVVQKNSEGFWFIPDDARKIKAEMTKRINNKKSPEDLGAQRYLLGQNQTDTSDYVSKSLNSKPVYFLDFIKILNALIEKNLVTLKEGITIEKLLELPEVDENNPLELSKKDISFKGNRIFLSETARDQINGLLFKKKLDMETLVSENNLNKDTLRRFLKGTAIHKNSFLTILNLLADEGVIKKPKTSFEALLVYDLVPDNFMITKPIDGETRILLKQDPANAIQARLMANRLKQESIATEAGFRKVLMVNNLLHDQTINPENLKKILRVLLDHQIITLPEGSDVDGFVDLVCAQSPSYPKTQAWAAASTTANCMASNGTQPAAMVVVSLSENGVATR